MPLSDDDLTSQYAVPTPTISDADLMARHGASSETWGQWASDIAKNTATGVARGAAGLADTAISALTPRSLLNPLTTTPEQLHKAYTPSSAVTGALESAPLYEPKTEAGRVYQGGVAGATAALPFGLAGAVPGFMGGAAQQGAADAGMPDWTLPLIGLSAGGATGIAQAGIKAGGTAALASPESRAISYLGKKLEPDIKYGVTSPEAITKQLTTYPDKQSMLADVSPGMTGEAERLANRPGYAYSTIRKNLQERDSNAGPQLIDDVSNSISGGGSAFNTAKALTSDQQQMAAPLYQRALSADLSKADADSVTRIRTLLKDPILQKAVAAGRDIQRTQALAKFQQVPPVEPYSNGLPHMQILQSAKIGLDQMLDQYRNPFTGKLQLDQKGSALLDLSKSFNNELRAVNPDYALANDTWAGPAASKEALALGQQFRKMRPEETADRLGDMTPSEKQFFLQGAADSLISTVEKTSGNEAKVFLGNQKIRDQLRPLFPSDELYDSTIGRLSEMNRQYQTYNAVMGNSRTGYRLSENQQNAPVISHLAAGGVGFGAGEPLVGALETSKGIGNWLKNISQPSQEVLGQAGRILTESDPTKRAALAKQIMESTVGARRGLVSGYAFPGMLGGQMTAFPMLSGQ